MSRFVSLSRAAKLVGISRGALQKKIHNLELESFEGQVNLDDIEKIYPDAQIEDNHIIEDLEKIVELALKRARGEKLAKLLSPDSHTLTARLQVVSKECSLSKGQLKQFTSLISQIQEKLSDLSSTSDKKYLFTDLNNWIDDAVEKINSTNVNINQLQEKDTLLRVMAAQVHIKNTGHEYFIEGNNSILEAGLSAGLALNYGCSNGNCGKCKAKLISGEIKKIKPHDYTFSENEKNQNYFLCCANTAVTEIEIEADEAGSENDIPLQEIVAKVKKVENLSDEVLLLNLKTPRTNRLRFLAGQNVILSRADLPPIEIPIASCPCDDMNIQFHIPYDDTNHFINYVSTALKNSDSIQIEGPTGAFVLDEDSDNAVIFIAFDTGFAPIKSLIEHAVTLEHAESIHLYWIHTEDKPYMHNQCRAWVDALDNFTYQQYQSDMSEQQLNKVLEKLVDEQPDLQNKNIFICGSENAVQHTQEILHKHGANTENVKSQVL